MTSQTTDQERPTFFECLKLMHLLWIFPILFTGAAMNGGASWPVGVLVFLMGVVAMCLLVRQLKLRRKATATDQVTDSMLVLKRNHELAGALEYHIKRTERIARGLSNTSAVVALREANQASQAVLDNKPIGP